MNPDLYSRLLDHADALDVTLTAKRVPIWRLRRVDGTIHPDGGYDPARRHVKLLYNDAFPDELVESTALHELGHAATLRVTPERIQQHSLETATGRISQQTKREEVAAWEWAAEHLSDEARAVARWSAGRALASYSVPPAEIERVQSLVSRPRGA